MNKKQKFPTTTSLVEEFLRTKDDFAKAAEVNDEVNKMETRAFDRTRNQVLAALHHLKANHAVGCVEEGGQVWWYYVKDQDTRLRTCDERTPEEKPRRPRRPRRVTIIKEN